jgi:putative membrane protein
MSQGQVPAPVQPKASRAETLPTLARGVVMGSADVVPGVSGGTMALILGIYPRLIEAIRNVDATLLVLAWGAVTQGRRGRRRFLEHAWAIDLGFLLTLLAGIAAALVSAAHVISRLLVSAPLAMLSLFFGLILVSAWIPWRMMPHHRPSAVAWLLVGAAAGYQATGLPTVEVTDASWFVPIAGAIAICAMILPGISGAFLLVVMGMYQRLLTAVTELDLLTIGLFGAGAAFGILSFSRLLSYLLRRHLAPTLAFLTGLMLGSLRKVWPFKDEYGAEFAAGRNILPAAGAPEVLLALGFFFAGAALVVILDALGRRVGRVSS